MLDFSPHRRYGGFCRLLGCHCMKGRRRHGRFWTNAFFEKKWKSFVEPFFFRKKNRKTNHGKTFSSKLKSRLLFSGLGTLRATRATAHNVSFSVVVGALLVLKFEWTGDSARTSSPHGLEESMGEELFLLGDGGQ